MRKNQKRPQAKNTKKQGAGQSAFRAVLIIAAALVVGLLMPSLFSAVQDLSTDRIDTVVDLGEGSLSLTSDEIKIEKLRAACLMQQISATNADEVIVTKLGSGKFMTAEEARNKLATVVALTAGTDLSLDSKQTYTVYEAEPVVITDTASLSTLDLAWTVYATWGEEDTQDWALSFLIDDTTGMVLLMSCQGPDAIDYGRGEYEIPDHTATVRRIAENMARAYGFTNTQLVPAERTGLNPFMNTYYINFMQEREVLYQLPVTIGLNGWAINAVSYY